jgi:PAS domain S-box-containing protein
MADVHHKAALYDLLLATVPEYAIFLLSPEGIITEWNEAIGRMFGYSEEELAGKHIEEIFTREDRAQGLPAKEIQSAIQEGSAVDLRWHVRKSGPPIFVDALVVPLREGGTVKQILTIVRDITPHKLVGGLPNPLTESMDDPFFLRDSSGRFIFVTNAAAALIGEGGKEQFTYLHPCDCWPERIARRWTEVDEQVRRDGKSVEFEIPICVKGGECIYSFRETPWRNSKGEVVGLVAVGRNVSEQRRLEKERNDLIEREKSLLSQRVEFADTELHRSHEQIRNLAGRLLIAQEEERSRIAREMHDDLAQRLAALNFELESLQANRRQGAAAPEENMTKLIQSVSLITEGVREISHRLHPAILEDLGLAPALRNLVEEFVRTYELPVQSLIDLPWNRAIPLAVSTTLYRIAQEALRNTIKHAGNASAVVELKEAENEEMLQLTIRDNGAGFDAEAVKAAAGGLGLASMKERARAVGGRLTVHSAPGAGTTVTVVVPWSTVKERTAADCAAFGS